MSYRPDSSPGGGGGGGGGGGYANGTSTPGSDFSPRNVARTGTPGGGGSAYGRRGIAGATADSKHAASGLVINTAGQASTRSLLSGAAGLGAGGGGGVHPPSIVIAGPPTAASTPLGGSGKQAPRERTDTQSNLRLSVPSALLIPRKSSPFDFSKLSKAMKVMGLTEDAIREAASLGLFQARPSANYGSGTGNLLRTTTNSSGNRRSGRFMPSPKGGTATPPKTPATPGSAGATAAGSAPGGDVSPALSSTPVHAAVPHAGSHHHLQLTPASGGVSAGALSPAPALNSSQPIRRYATTTAGGGGGGANALSTPGKSNNLLLTPTTPVMAPASPMAAPLTPNGTSAVAMPISATNHHGATLHRTPHSPASADSGSVPILTTTITLPPPLSPMAADSNVPAASVGATTSSLGGGFHRRAPSNLNASAAATNPHLLTLPTTLLALSSISQPTTPLPQSAGTIVFPLPLPAAGAVATSGSGASGATGGGMFVDSARSDASASTRVTGAGGSGMALQSVASPLPDPAGFGTTRTGQAVAPGFSTPQFVHSHSQPYAAAPSSASPAMTGATAQAQNRTPDRSGAPDSAVRDRDWALDSGVRTGTPFDPALAAARINAELKLDASGLVDTDGPIVVPAAADEKKKRFGHHRRESSLSVNAKTIVVQPKVSAAPGARRTSIIGVIGGNAAATGDATNTTNRAWKNKLSKAAKVLGMDETQINRAKALRVLGVSDYEIEEDRAKALSRLGVSKLPPPPSSPNQKQKAAEREKAAAAEKEKAAQKLQKKKLESELKARAAERAAREQKENDAERKKRDEHDKHLTGNAVVRMSPSPNKSPVLGGGSGAPPGRTIEMGVAAAAATSSPVSRSRKITLAPISNKPNFGTTPPLGTTKLGANALIKAGLPEQLNSLREPEPVAPPRFADPNTHLGMLKEASVKSQKALKMLGFTRDELARAKALERMGLTESDFQRGLRMFPKGNKVMRELETKFGASPTVEVVKANQLRRTSTIAPGVKGGLLGLGAGGGGGGMLKRTSTGIVGPGTVTNPAGIYHSTPLRASIVRPKPGAAGGTGALNSFSAAHLQAQKSRAERARVLAELKEKTKLDTMTKSSGRTGSIPNGSGSARSPTSSHAAKIAAAITAAGAAGTGAGATAPTGTAASAATTAADEKTALWAEREKAEKEAAAATASSNAGGADTKHVAVSDSAVAVSAAGLVSISAVAATDSSRGRSREPQAIAGAGRHARTKSSRKAVRSHAAARRRRRRVQLYRSIPRAVRRNNHPLPPPEDEDRDADIDYGGGSDDEPEDWSEALLTTTIERELASRPWFYDPRKHKSAKLHLVLGMDEVQVRRAKALMVLGIPDFDYEVAFEKELATLGYGNGPQQRIAMPAVVVPTSPVNRAPAPAVAASRYAIASPATGANARPSTSTTAADDARRRRARDSAIQAQRASLVAAAASSGTAPPMIISPYGASPIDPRLRMNPRKSIINSVTRSTTSATRSVATASPQKARAGSDAHGASPAGIAPGDLIVAAPRSSPSPATGPTSSPAPPPHIASIAESPPPVHATITVPPTATAAAPGGAAPATALSSVSPLKPNVFTFNVATPATATVPATGAPAVATAPAAVGSSPFTTPAPALSAAARARPSPLPATHTLGAGSRLPNAKLPSLSPRTGTSAQPAGVGLSPRQPLPALGATSTPGTGTGTGPVTPLLPLAAPIFRLKSGATPPPGAGAGSWATTSTSLSAVAAQPPALTYVGSGSRIGPSSTSSSASPSPFGHGPVTSTSTSTSNGGGGESSIKMMFQQSQVQPPPQQQPQATGGGASGGGAGGNPWDAWKSKLTSSGADFVKEAKATLEAQAHIDPDAKADYWWMIKNEHALIGIARASKYHPYTRRMRLLNLIFCVCASFMFAAITEQSKSDCEPDPALSQADKDSYVKSCKADAEDDALILSVVFGAVVAICGMILRAAAECKCFLGVPLKCFRDCCTSLGACFNTFSMLWTIVFIVVGIVVIVDTTAINGGAFMLSFAISQGGSWVFEFPIIAAKFFWTRRSELKLPEKDTMLEEYRRLKAEFKAKKKDGGVVATASGGGVGAAPANQMMIMSGTTPTATSGAVSTIGPAPNMPPVMTMSAQPMTQPQQQQNGSGGYGGGGAMSLPGMVSSSQPAGAAGAAGGSVAIDIQRPARSPSPPMPAMGPTTLSSSVSDASAALGAAASSLTSLFRTTAAPATATPAPAPAPVSVPMTSMGVSAQPQAQPQMQSQPQPQPVMVPFSTNMQFNAAPAPVPVVMVPTVVMSVAPPQPVMMMAPQPQQQPDMYTMNAGGGGGGLNMTPQPNNGMMMSGGSSTTTSVKTTSSTTMSMGGTPYYQSQSGAQNVTSNSNAFGQPQPQPQPQPVTNNGFGQSFGPGAGFSGVNQPMQMQQPQQQPQQYPYQQQQPQYQPQPAAGMNVSYQSNSNTNNNNSAAALVANVKASLPSSLSKFF